MPMKTFFNSFALTVTILLRLTNKTLMIVSIDIPLHASLPGSRERTTLHKFSPDSLVYWSINYGDKGIPVKDCRDRGGCCGCCMNKLNRVNV